MTDELRKKITKILENNLFVRHGRYVEDGDEVAGIDKTVEALLSFHSKHQEGIKHTQECLASGTTCTCGAVNNRIKDLETKLQASEKELEMTLKAVDMVDIENADVSMLVEENVKLESKLKHQDERVKELESCLRHEKDGVDVYKQQVQSLEARVKELQSIVDGKCVPVGYYSDRQVADMEKKIKELETKLSSPATLGVEELKKILDEHLFISHGKYIEDGDEICGIEKAIQAITALLKKVGV